jgi:hypothetical protein
MAFKYNTERNAYEFIGRVAENGDPIMISAEAYALYQKACEEGEPERDASYLALAEEAKMIMDRTLDLLVRVSEKHKVDTYNRAMKAVVASSE